MSKKHFEAMAEEIKALRERAILCSPDEGRSLWAERANGAEDIFVLVATQFNPRFDETRFRAACQPRPLSALIGA